MKKNKTYIATFILSVICCVLIAVYAMELIYIFTLPLIATNLFLPFFILDSKTLTAKWQFAFFVLVPFASFMYIFADGLPSTIYYFKEQLNKLK